LPKGLFSFAAEGGACSSNPLATVVMDDTVGRKRRRDLGGNTNSPDSECMHDDDLPYPPLVEDDDNDRPRKRLREQSKSFTITRVVSSSLKRQERKKQSTGLTKTLPRDVVAHCLSFLGSAEDRFSLQTTCKLFRHLSNADSMLANVDVAGDPETGKGGIIQEHDTPASAAESLSPFARAGNLEAMYM
jgi:hypothetical protein